MVRRIEMGYFYSDEELAHHGILGQKWGVRRFQNPDGTLTAKGKLRKQKVESYRDKLGNRASGNSKMYSNRAEKAKFEFEDLKKFGSDSNTYRLWEKEQEENDLKKYPDEPYKVRSERFTRLLNTGDNLKQLMSEKDEKFNRYSKRADQWMKVNQEIMNTSIGDLTSKRDVRKSYRGAISKNVY
jgi:hypothetical protein